MIQGIPVGPFLFPYPLVLLLGAFFLAMWLGRRKAGTAGGTVPASRLLQRDFDHHWYALLLLALIAARLAFVIDYRSLYADVPWKVLDVRDGGWTLWAGVATAVVYAACLGVRKQALRTPMWVALTSMGLVMGVGLSVPRLLGSTPALPSLTVRQLDGTPISLSAYEGRPVVLNLWASWCPPCIREMPVLAKAQQAHPGLNVVFLNQGETPETVARFLAQQGLALENVLVDPPASVARAYGLKGFPATYFFDAEGRLQDARVGELSDATLHARLKRLQP